MANVSIPNLPVAISLDGSEELEIVQPPGSASGVSKRATAQQIANLAPVSAVTLPINLATQVSGVLPVGNGGSGTSTLTANGVLLGNGTGGISAVAPATATYVLTANGTSSAPTFQAAGGLSNQPGLSVLGVTGNATASPAGITGTTDQVLRVSPNGTALLFGQVNLSSTSAITGSLASSSISGIFAVPFGGTGTSVLTANGVVLGNGTSAVNVATAGSAGQIFVGQSTLPSFQTMTGDLTLNSAGSAVIAANAVTFAKFQTMQALSVHGNSSSATTNSTAIVGTANQALLVNAAGTGLAFGLIPVSASLTGVVPVSNGGSGTSSLTAHGVLIGSGTSAVTISAVGTNGQLLIGQTGADPAWTTESGDVTLSSAGTATIANNAVTFAKFQTMAALSVHGNSSSATTNSVAIAGTANQVLVVNSAGTGLAFGQVNIATGTGVTGVLPVGNGGSGTSALTAHGLLIGAGTSTVVISAVGSNAQVLLGQTGADPTWNTMSGDVTLSSVGTATIANNAVTYAKFQQPAALSVVANSSSATANAVSLAGTADQVLRVNSAGTALAFGTVNLGAAAAITGSLTSANIATAAFLMLATTGQAFSGGVTLTSLSLGTAAATTTTLVAGNPPLQRIVVNGTAAFVAPSSECEIDILVSNAASASTISFSGYSVGSNTGDAYTTTSGQKFILMSRTINGSSTYAWKALQ